MHSDELRSQHGGGHGVADERKKKEKKKKKEEERASGERKEKEKKKLTLVRQEKRVDHWGGGVRLTLNQEVSSATITYTFSL